MNIYQLWGLEPLDEARKERVVRILEQLLAASPKVIMTGQCEDRRFLTRLCDMAHGAGTKVYQWTPLFSEWDDRAVYDPIRTASGAALPRPYGSEFNFRCPGSRKNIDLFLKMQDEAMENVPFDGVFLDRVRYPSFSYGDLSETACFCDSCLALYRERGVNAEALREALFAPREEGRLQITGASEGRILFADENVQRFFDTRAEVITNAVRRIAAHYAEQGRGVALDLFPPQIAYLVGQLLPELLPFCSFVKPMIYRYTEAPARLPYERDAFDRATGLLEALDACFGPRPLQGQIQAYEEIAARCGKDIYWGIESVSVPGIAEMTPERILESRREIAAGGGKHYCMSWSVLVMPQENIDAWTGENAEE